MNEPIKILSIEGNPADAELVREWLKNPSGLLSPQLIHARTLQEALDLVRTTDVHAILLDLNLPDATGLESLKRMRSVTPSIPIVVITVAEEEPLALVAIQSGAQDYILKSQMHPGLLSRGLLYAMEREKNERAELESERKFRLFVEGATGLAFILLDPNGNIIHWNSGAKKLFGYQEEAALGRYFSFLFSPGDPKQGRPEAELENARKQEKGDDDHWLVRADGTRFWASGAVTAIRDDKENLIGFAKVVRDNSLQKEANDKLAHLNRTLEERVNTRTRELVRNQERLRAMASDLILTEQRERRRLASDLHDYLAQLLVVCRLKLNQGQLSHDMDGMRKIMQEADQCLDQSLTYTRTLVTQLCPTCLYEFGLHAALVWLGSEMEKQGLTVHLKKGNGVLILPEDHAILIYQSVRELLHNVLKHSRVKEATVMLSIQPDNRLHIQVEDRGRGFDHSHVERDEGSSTKFGLFSIRERLEALDGTMTITSIPQNGTQVLLQVPLKTGSGKSTHQGEIAHFSPPSTPMHYPQSSSENIRILLVDDHEMVREGFCHILNAQGDLKVVGEAEDGKQAIALCQSLRPDVVVMDLQMPNMNGLEACKRIKREFPGTVIIGLSVYDNSEVARWFLDVAADAFVTKGGSAESLISVIRQYGRDRSPS